MSTIKNWRSCTRNKRLRGREEEEARPDHGGSGHGRKGPAKGASPGPAGGKEGRGKKKKKVGVITLLYGCTDRRLHGMNHLLYI